MEHISKLKSREISFAHNLLPSCQIVSTFYTEHGSATAVLCAKIQNDLTTEMDVMDERDFTRFRFTKSFGQQPSDVLTIQHPKTHLEPVELH